MRAFVRTILVCLCLGALQTVSADQTAEALLRTSSTRARSMRALTARIELSWGSPKQSLKRSAGRIKLMKPNFALIELTGDYPLSTLASDGRSRYVVSDVAKYSLSAADPNGKNIDAPWWIFPVRFFFTQDLKPFGPDSPSWTRIRFAGTETIDGVAYRVLEIAGDKPMNYTAQYYFDDRVLRRSVVKFVEGPVFTAQIEEVKTATNLRSKDFVFRPPPDAKLDTGAEAKMLALGETAPDFSLSTSDGKLLTLESARQGKKATLINFWYLGCPPCRAEFELFQKLYAKLKDEGFSIVAINNIDKASEVEAYRRETGITFPMAMAEREPGVLSAYRIETYPSTYVVNAEGKIVYRAVGVDEPGLLRTLRELGLRPEQNAEAQVYEFKNGRWFDGRSFRKTTFYSVLGRLTTQRPSRINETIDLKDGFVIPPFADAHSHHFDSSYNIDQQIETYLRDGVFYAAVQTNLRSGAVAVANKVNKPGSVDVAYSHGALTSSFGHGVEVYEGLALFRRPGAINPEEVKKLRESHVRENDAYYVIDSADDLERKWPTILKGRPDFIKVYLLTSEEYESRRKRTDTIGDRGIDPKLLPSIVKKARAASLRVSAHVDTVTDYRIALGAGVDQMAHLPGYYIGPDDNPLTYKLSDTDARQTAKTRTWVIVAPVAYEMFNPKSSSYDRATASRTDEVRVHNLKLLLAHKAPLAFGSDRYGNTPVDDVLYLHKLGVFSSLELLKIWSESTPRMIFPHRKIGRLANGYEASFLVLAGNPLENFNHIRNIRMRFKQGLCSLC